MKDYYKILGITREASVSEIRKSYRNMSLKLHPDVNSALDANQKFIELGEAYEVLKNPRKKRQYDKLYDFKVLKISPKRNYSYQKHSKKWHEDLIRRHKKGGENARRNSGQKYSEFKKKTKKDGYFDGFWMFVEFIVGIGEVIIGALTSAG